MQERHFVGWLVILFICNLVSTGCSQSQIPAHPATGQVVFKSGSPVQVGTVELKSREHGIHARGEITRDGRFVLTTYESGDGAVAGLHDCVVVQMVIVEDVAQFRPSTYGIVHPRFGSYASAGLQVEIVPQQANDLRIIVEGLSPRTAKTGTKGHAHKHTE